MAQQDDYQKEGLFQNLAKLFRSNIIVRKDKSGKLRVKDIDLTQQSVSSNFVDRYSKIHTTSNMGYAKQQQAAFNIQRLELFKDYELMDSDPIISSALDIYSDECTVNNQEGETLEITTYNNKLHDILHNLFYDVLNIDFNLWSWIRNIT